jgi:hypothetical protein
MSWAVTSNTSPEVSLGRGGAGWAAGREREGSIEDLPPKGLCKRCPYARPLYSHILESYGRRYGEDLVLNQHQSILVLGIFTARPLNPADRARELMAAIARFGYVGGVAFYERGTNPQRTA